MKPVGYYQRLRNRQLIEISLVVSALFLAYVLLFGVPLGRDFKGGSLIMVQGLESVPGSSNVKYAVENSLGKNVDVLSVENGFHIETDNLSESEETNVKGTLFNQFGIPTSSVIIEPIGPAISSLQSEQMLYSIIVAFIVIGIITFIIFRRRVVPLAVLLVVGLDILCVLGYMALFSVPLGLTSIMAIVMLIGYAVDTNILLAYRVLKRVGGEPREQATASLNTGLMTGVLLVVILLILNIVTSAMQFNVLTAILIFGIAINILNTWFLGAGILLGRAERQRGKEYHVSL
jgi:preprotein translocase subunit SecF